MFQIVCMKVFIIFFISLYLNIINAETSISKLKFNYSFSENLSDSLKSNLQWQNVTFGLSLVEKNFLGIINYDGGIIFGSRFYTNTSNPSSQFLNHYTNLNNHPSLIMGITNNFEIFNLIFFKVDFGEVGPPEKLANPLVNYQSSRYTTSFYNYYYGLTSEILTNKFGLPFDISVALIPGDFRGNSIEFTYRIGGEKKRNSGSQGPSAKVDSKGGVSRPGATGSSEIDNFVTSTFDLNDNIVDLKEKLESVSSGLSKSNAVLTDIGNSASGPVGWAMMELQKGIAKSKNSIISSAQSLQSDVPDLPEIYFDLIKKSMIAPQTLEELAKGTQPEEALLLTFNKKADEKGIPTTSKDWIMGLNLNLDPTKTLRTKLGTIKDGVMGGNYKLASVPDDLKGIGSQAQALLSSATELPKTAKSLGLKAPKALKAIKATTDVLKNIPNEVKSIGDETKKVIEEVDQVLKNIQNILSTS